MKLLRFLFIAIVLSACATAAFATTFYIGYQTSNVIQVADTNLGLSATTVLAPYNVYGIGSGPGGLYIVGAQGYLLDPQDPASFVVTGSSITTPGGVTQDLSPDIYLDPGYLQAPNITSTPDLYIDELGADGLPIGVSVLLEPIEIAIPASVALDGSGFWVSYTNSSLNLNQSVLIKYNPDGSAVLVDNGAGTPVPLVVDMTAAGLIAGLTYDPASSALLVGGIGAVYNVPLAGLTYNAVSTFFDPVGMGLLSTGQNGLVTSLEVVPEPTTLVLLGSGLLGLGLRRRKKA